MVLGGGKKSGGRDGYCIIALHVGVYRYVWNDHGCIQYTQNSNNNVGVMRQARGISALTPSSCCDNTVSDPINAGNAGQLLTHHPESQLGLTASLNSLYLHRYLSPPDLQRPKTP